jgi:hypothetical protein
MWSSLRGINCPLPVRLLSRGTACPPTRSTSVGTHALMASCPPFASNLNLSLLPTDIELLSRAARPPATSRYDNLSMPRISHVLLSAADRCTICTSRWTKEVD